jgi:hypothetical protein
MSAIADILVRIDVLETLAAKGAAQTAAQLRHLIDVRERRENGTGSLEQDLVYGNRLAITTTATDLDLTALTSELDGSTLTFAELTGVYLVHRGTTTAQNLLVGGATNAVGIFSDATDIAVVGPSGKFIVESPIDGYTITNSSSDILRLDASTGSFDVDVILIGRSA